METYSAAKLMATFHQRRYVSTSGDNYEKKKKINPQEEYLYTSFVNLIKTTSTKTNPYLHISLGLKALPFVNRNMKMDNNNF